MTRWVLGLAATAGVAGAAAAQTSAPAAQTPGGYPPAGAPAPSYPAAGGAPGYQYQYAPAPGAYLPNFYNRQYQPLSPYLNLFRGGNPGVNYFYGVRPGTVGGASALGGGVGVPVSPASQARTGFLPGVGLPTQDPVQIPAAGAVIPAFQPTSHPVTFGGGGQRLAPGGNRNALTGGPTRPAAPRPAGRR